MSDTRTAEEFYGIEGYGVPREGGGRFAKELKIEQGKHGEVTSTLFRLGLPMKSCAETGEWAVYAPRHFGYKGVNTRDPKKPFYRRFRCPQEKDWETKMVTVECAECDLIAARRLELADAVEVAKARLREQGKLTGRSEKEVEDLVGKDEAVAQLKAWGKEHRRDSKWVMNVFDRNMEPRFLFLSTESKKRVEALRRQMRDENKVDIFSPRQGVWFSVNRTGDGFAVRDTIHVVTEAVQVEGMGVVNKVKLAPLTAQNLTQALAMCPDLHDAVPVISQDQIKLLASSGGYLEPAEVDRIFALGGAAKLNGQSRRATPAESAPAAPGASPGPAPEKPRENASAASPGVKTGTAADSPAVSEAPSMSQELRAFLEKNHLTAAQL